LAVFLAAAEVLALALAVQAAMAVAAAAASLEHLLAAKARSFCS
jgi:hypothetical protein